MGPATPEAGPAPEPVLARTWARLMARPCHVPRASPPPRLDRRIGSSRPDGTVAAATRKPEPVRLNPPPLRRRRLLVAASAAWPRGGRANADAALDPASPEGGALVARLREGGLVLFIRHADTAGEPCDRGFRVGDRDGQRNISPAGRRQAAAIGPALATLGVPVAFPVLAGPVFRARDTAELAFGAERVQVVEGLTADDYAGDRLGWILREHRRLFAVPVPAGTNRVLVGHRGPVQMILGDRVRGTRLPEAGALVLEPKGAAGFAALGVLAVVPRIGDGDPGCR